MKSKISTSTLLAASMILTGSAVTNSALAQGSLTPPGGPTPTMKTLDQLEPRTPISTSGYVITNSGSYYLTRNLGIPRLSGGTIIVIRANEVTLDMNGFYLDGSGMIVVRGFTGGIVVSGNHTNISVFNGGFQNCTAGLDASAAFNSHFDRLRFQHNSTGLTLGTNCWATACFAEDNIQGIQVGQCCVVSHCSSSLNQKGFNILGSLNRIDSNMANNNSSSGFEIASGMFGNVVVRNQASGNGCNMDFVLISGNSWGHVITAGTTGEILSGSGWENFAGFNCIP